MGNCCCCRCHDKDDDAGDNTAGTELSQVSFTVARSMSAPSVDVVGLKVSGYGLALASVSLEQDAGYWEILVLEAPNSGSLSVGVSPRRDRQFFNTKGNEEGQDEEEPSSDAAEKGTELMSAIDVNDGDVVGIAMQQSDLPMLQIFINGERVDAINRFRGSVYPAVYLHETASIEFVFRGCQKEPPNARFLPILEARGLV